MRGFSTRAPVEAALAWIDAHAAPLPSESASLSALGGRILAEDVRSLANVPSFARAMMDGFALRASDSQGASSYNPHRLTVVGESLPGREFAGLVLPGQAVRIMTGAPVPSGADAVLPAERSTSDGDGVSVLDEVTPGKHIGPVGEDIAIGDLVAARGRRLRPQDLGVLSSIGVATALLIRQPRVRIAVTGNELLAPGSRPQGNSVSDANGPMLEALVTRDGGIPINPGLVADDRQAIRAALSDEADVVLVSGGSSVGQEDFAPGLLAEMGAVAFHGIAMRPSSPAGMGRIGGKLVFLLPGNPVSCLCAYDFFAGRAIRLLGGRQAAWPYRETRLPLARKLVSAIGRLDYARVEIVEGRVYPLATGGASILTSTTRASGFVVVPSDCEGYAPGTEVSVWLYD